MPRSRPSVFNFELEVQISLDMASFAAFFILVRGNFTWFRKDNLYVHPRGF